MSDPPEEPRSLFLDLLKPRSDPRRGEAMSWALHNLDKINWVGPGARGMNAKCSVCRQHGHNKRTCVFKIKNYAISE